MLIGWVGQLTLVGSKSMPRSKCDSWSVVKPCSMQDLTICLEVTDYEEHGDANTMTGSLDAYQAKKLLDQLRAESKHILTGHLREELEKDRLTTLDCMNVLRCGRVEHPEWENGRWRYRVHTPKMTVIVEIDEDQREFTIVTAWRNK